jgi:hypothetical protein
MAQRTIAPGGGLWNSTATWVEGAVPTTSDHIVGDATSGQLTVNVNATVQFLNFSGYTALLTINNNIQLTLGLAASTSTFSAAGTYDFIGAGSTQGRIGKANIAMTFNMLGTTPIPCFINTGNATLTAASDLYFINILQNATLVINGSFNTYISGNFVPNISLRAFGGTQPYNMVGTGTLGGVVGGTAASFLNFPGTLNINTLGTITITNFFQVCRGVTSSGSADITATFTHLAGTIVNPTLVIEPNVTTIFPASSILNLISGTTWDVFLNLKVGSNSSFNIIEFNGVANFNEFNIGNLFDAGTSVEFLSKIQGNANIICNDLTFGSAFKDTGGAAFQRNSIDLILTPSQSITVNNSININGGTNEPDAIQTPPIEIKSTTGGTQANLIVNNYNQFVSRTRFTDIDCSGGNTLYGQDLTLSNTTNISQYTLPPSSGGTSQTAYTFAS